MQTNGGLHVHPIKLHEIMCVCHDLQEVMDMKLKVLQGEIPHIHDILCIP